MKQSAIIALAVAGASANVFNKRQLFDVPSEGPEEAFNDHVSQVCSPRTSTGHMDLNAPCNALLTIQYQCSYGSSVPDILQEPDTEDDMEDTPTLLSKETQRDCICQSQHNDMISGCLACFKEHGSTEPGLDATADDIFTIMDKYCKADEPPTKDYFMAIYEIAENADKSSSTEVSSTSTAPATFSDPIGNATDVSLYFTPSVTGTAAYMPVLPTAESSGANATYTSVSTSDGQIVPTAAGGDSGDGSGSDNASATESDSGAVQTAMAQVGAMGALGVAALMAAL
ncbi:hypothetical protein Q7P37_004988 [Cladosporium fusiforme]